MCQTCAWMDNCLCSLRTKMHIFWIWTLCHGIVFFCYYIYSVRKWYNKLTHEQQIFGDIVVNLGAIHVVAGCMLTIGFLSNLPNAFMFGVVLSTLLPMVNFQTYLFYMIFSQVVFIWFSVRHYRTGMNRDSQTLQNV